MNDIDKCFELMEAYIRADERNHNGEYYEVSLSDKEIAIAADLDLANWIEDLVA
jgi:hypothetical protein